MLDIPEYSLFPGLGVPFTSKARQRRAISSERLPTNTTTHRHPVHRWFNFIAGFSPEFVAECIAPLEKKSTSLVLDPFAGCATALVVACQQGMQAIGFEPHPVLVRIARAKLPSSHAVQLLDRIQKAIENGLQDPRPIHTLSPDPARFLAKLFSLETLEALIGARESLRQQGLFNEDLAFLILSRIVEKSSHSQTDGIYKAPTSRKTPVMPLQACLETVHLVRTDLQKQDHARLDELGRVHAHSSEWMTELLDGSVDVVVTSPPYLNNFDFAEMTRMLLYFWEIATSWGDITDKVRKLLVVNTTTALKGHKEKQQKYRANIPGAVVPALDQLVQELASRRKIRAGKKEYDHLVYPYFAQMSAVLHECFRCLKPGGVLHVVVADAALYGVHISTPQFLRDILDQIGFRETACSLLRRRGHRWILNKREGSKTGLGEYHVHGSR